MLILKSWHPRKEEDPHTRVDGVQIHRHPSGPHSPSSQHLLWLQQQGLDLIDPAQLDFTRSLSVPLPGIRQIH